MALKTGFCGIVRTMISSGITTTANLFLALGDITRLRLLNLMRESEVCVSSFTEVLGQSQPLVSRHLAYLRNAGVVAARRDGKWIHYSISDGLDPNTRRLMTELFKWMEDQPFLNEERGRYLASKPTAAKQRNPRRRDPDPRPPPVIEGDHIERPERVREFVEVAHHNELEDFLL